MPDARFFCVKQQEVFHDPSLFGLSGSILYRGKLYKEKYKDKDIESLKECPECHSKNIVWDYRGEVYCEDCGLVLRDVANMCHEWYYYSLEQRVESGELDTYAVFGKGLGTPPSLMRKLMKRLKLRKESLRLFSEEVLLSAALDELTRISYALNIPRDVRRECGKKLHQIYLNKDLRWKGHTLSLEDFEVNVPAIIYLTCLEYKLNRSLDEIAKVSRVSKRKIAMRYRVLSHIFNVLPYPLTPSNFIHSICDSLGLNGEIRKTAINLVQSVEDGWGENNPLCIAASAIYAAILLRENNTPKTITQQKIAEVAGIADFSIRRIYKKLLRGERQ